MENFRRADGRTYFMNRNTGEIIWKLNRFTALLYFIADGKKHGYEVDPEDILDADGIRQEYGWTYTCEETDGKSI